MGFFGSKTKPVLSVEIVDPYVLQWFNDWVYLIYEPLHYYLSTVLSLKLNDWLNCGSVAKGLAQFQIKEGYGGNTILDRCIADGAIPVYQCDSWDNHGNQQ